MAYLHDNGFTPITLKELNQIWQNKQPMPAKPIILTFDDGDHGVYQYAYPILQKHGFHFVLFVITRWTSVHTAFYLGKADILDMLKSGLVEVGSHTRNHVNVQKAFPLKTLWEVYISRSDIKRLLNYDATSFCFPLGGHNKTAIAALRICGYTMATTTTDGLVDVKQSHYLLKRIRIDGADRLQDFISKVTVPLGQ